MFLFICSLLFSEVYSQSGWQLQNPKFTDDIIYCKWINHNTAFLAGFNFSLVKTTDGGKTWKHKTNGIILSDDVATIQLPGFINENTGYILTNKIYKTTNGGDFWFPVSESIVWKASVAADGVIYAIKGAENPKLTKTTNDGASWSELKNVNEVNFVNISFLNAQTGFYTNSPDINQKTTDGGNTWINVNINQTGTLRNLASISFVNNTGYGIMEGRMLKTTDSGLNWFEISLVGPTEVQAISDNIVVATTGGVGNRKMAKSFDGGNTWTLKNLPEFLYVSFYNENLGFAFYHKGVLYKTINLGETFLDIGSNFGFNVDLVKVQTISKDKSYALSFDSSLFLTSDRGMHWDKIPLALKITSFKFYDENFGFASNGSGIYKTSNGGYNWQIRKEIPQVKNFNTVGENKFYFLNKQYDPSTARSDSSFVRYSENGGQTYRTLYSKGDIHQHNLIDEVYNFRSLNFINESTGYLISNVTTLLFGWSYDYDSWIVRTTDAGETWEELCNIDHTTGGTLQLFESGIGYLTNDFGLCKTTNGGFNWNVVSSMSVGFGAIDFINETTGYAALNGSIYVTVNGGSNWTLQADYRSVRDIDMLNSSIGYAVGEGGTICFTNNGGVGVTRVSSFVNNYSLSQNYPNPFNPTTKINFAIPKSGIVQIKVYDLIGREVQILVNEFKATGEYTVDFNGSSLSNGVYFYKLITNDFVDTKKMILVK